MSDLPTLYVDPDAPERGAFTEQTCGDAPPTVVRYVPASVADALRAELARVRELGLDATDRAERLASELTDLRAENERLRRERDALIQRRFPIMDGPSIPWSVIAPHEAQAHRNHDQTLELLAQRGGLGAIEAVAVLEDQAYPRGRDVQAEKARCLAVLNAINDKHAALAARAEKAEAERDEWKAKAEQCDDCENFAGIRVCTGCWAKHVAAAHDAARARVAKVEAEQDKARADWQTLWADQHHYVGPCAACAGSGETTDARPCPGCAGTGDKYETWKETAEAAVSRAAALEAACRFTVAMEADADDAYRRLKRAAFACHTALKGDTAALVERIATAVEGLERWRSEPAERADDGEMLGRADVLATIRAKGG